jgi:GH35 family endo-1,4-beta-xylanase
MKTIKYFATLLMMFAFTASLNAQVLTKDQEKAVKKEVKKLEKDGWKVKPGAPSLAMQITRSSQAAWEQNSEGMDKWISGMMEACDGKVKAWDVVNEAISGADKDGDGKYDLQHESDNDNDFFWQNYLGDLDYVRTAVKLARKYGPEDVKLFINDYNLESDWDGNAKLKSLIQWIKDWEADGVTKIDGIGTQMHISYYLDPKTQESKQKAVENAFKLMAESGKLVRISELDMGLVDADGNDVATALVTEEQHKAMAAYYTWIIKTYLSVIPAAQQWGITQWCATDSPADSGWRANSPVGLWDKDYYRKHTYAGFADGLSGK